jgi:Leucine-rich repeat (LRR) protein
MASILRLLAAAAVWGSVADAVSVDYADIVALRSLFDAAGGDNWNWGNTLVNGPVWSFSVLNQADPCADASLGTLNVWQGLECNKMPSICAKAGAVCAITSLVLRKFNLTGTIPSELGQISTLTDLRLSTNSLDGTIPSELGLLVNLENFMLADNFLQGSIPSSLGLLTSLTELWLNVNSLDGTIPSELGLLVNLEYLILTSNCLQGSIPSSLGLISSLRVFYLHVNSLDGTIPSELGLLVNSEYLTLSNNLLQGSIPSSLGLLTLLTELWLDDNSLDGTIPSELGLLVNLEILVLEYNCLQGSIPSSLGLLTSLAELWLNVNRLDGTIPSKLGLLVKLEWLALGDNRLQGSIPSSLGLLTSLKGLYLNGNSLDGTIPSEIGLLVNSERLSLPKNCLQGSIPSSLGLLTSLTGLWLDDNSLDGTIPSELGLLVNLEWLILTSNCLQGSIPSSLGLLTSLTDLWLSTNSLDGSIPSELGNLTAMFYLKLSDCAFVGTIPSTLGALVRLNSLQLQNNHLQGEVPISFAGLSVLMVLRIENNQLTGDLNLLFNTWAQDADSLLETIDISNNLFSGLIPSGLFFLPNIKSIAAVSACFAGELPATLCLPPKLEVLILNGLSNADGCNHDSLLDNNFGAMRGTIPHCVYSMPNLNSLSIVDNGFYGSFGALAVNSSLLSLEVSHNHLTGSIPAEFLRHSFRVLDVSHNRISHTISALQIDTAMKLNLVLQVNRISGDVPESVDSSSIDDLNILRGNAFACSEDSSRATEDPGKENTRCGSSDLDFALYFVIFVIVILGVVAACCWACVDSLFFSSLRKRALGAVHLLARLDTLQPRSSLLQRFVMLATVLCVSCAFCSLLICLVCTMIFGFLKMSDGEGSYETHTFQYSFFMSAAMLSGELPAALLVAMWVLMTLLLFWLLVFCEGVLYQAPEVVNHGEPHAFVLKPFLFIASFMVVINVMVSLTLNGVYVAALLSDTSIVPRVVLQLAVAFLRIIWSKIISVAIFHPMLSIGHHTKAVVLSAIFVFNNIVAPCLVVLFTDPSCFVDLFVEPAELTSSYSYEECFEYSSQKFGDRYFTACATFGIVDSSVTYSPLFVYNFQCGTSLIRAFVPVVLASYCFSIMISMFLICLANCEECLTRKIDSFMGFLVPKLIRGSTNIIDSTSSSSVVADSDNSTPLFLYPFEVALLAERLVMLFTFGLATPYVALVCGLSSLMIWLRILFTLFVYVDKRDAWNDAQVLGKLNSAADGIQYFTMHTIWTMVGFVSCLYIGLLAVDIALDGSSGDTYISWEVAMLFLLMPLCLCTVLWMLSLCVRKADPGEHPLQPTEGNKQYLDQKDSKASGRASEDGSSGVGRASNVQLVAARWGYR